MNIRSIIDRIRFMTMHRVWRAEITGSGEIDEAVFEEIYRTQEEKDGKEEIQ